MYQHRLSRKQSTSLSPPPAPSPSPSNTSSRKSRREARRKQQQQQLLKDYHDCSRKARRIARRKREKELEEYQKKQNRILAECANKPCRGPPNLDEYDGYDWPDRDQQEVQGQWRDVDKPKYDHLYYWNSTTKEARWEPPPGYNLDHQGDCDETYDDDCASVSSEATTYLSDASDDVHDQGEGTTCTAYAYATVVRTNERSAGGRPLPHNGIVSGVVDRWAAPGGLHWSEHLQLLSYEGSKRNFGARRITLEDALWVLQEGRAVYTTFCLSGPQWKRMDDKLKTHPRTVVRAEDLGAEERRDQEDLGAYEGVRGTAHCVAIVGWNKTKGYFYMKNSYGVRYGDGGYFRLHKNATKLWLYELIDKSQISSDQLH